MREKNKKKREKKVEKLINSVEAELTHGNDELINYAINSGGCPKGNDRLAIGCFGY